VHLKHTLLLRHARGISRHIISLVLFRSKALGELFIVEFYLYYILLMLLSWMLDHSTTEHMNKALKQWYWSIKNLVADYNKHQLSMIKLHGQHRIPYNAVIPPPIEMKGLFSPDVDNDIWQDIGLADDEFGGTVPPWLGMRMSKMGFKSFKKSQIARMSYISVNMNGPLCSIGSTMNLLH
jgi:hypothetical protein